MITDGTKDDTHAFDEHLLPLAEEILLVLVKVVEPRLSTLENFSNVAPNSDRGKVFSAMVNYSLRFARLNDIERSTRWSQTIRADFTRRLDRSVESSFEFSYTLGVYLSNLLYLDEEWVIHNLPRIFPQRNESHWQAAFSGYLLYSQVYRNIYSLLKTHGHYQKALNTNFADDEVVESLVNHICIGWIQNWEILDDDTSLIYQLINDGTPEHFSAVVHFFLEQSDELKESDKPEKMKAYEKVKAKVKPAWHALYQILSQNSDIGAYQEILGPLSGWLGLIDTIDVDVLSWVKESIKYIDKPNGYGVTLSRFFKALLNHTSETPEAVGKIYLEIPQRIMKDLPMEEDDIKETVRILYNNGYENIADNICKRFAKADALFLRTIYEEYQKP